MKRFQIVLTISGRNTADAGGETFLANAQSNTTGFSPTALIHLLHRGVFRLGAFSCPLQTRVA